MSDTVVRITSDTDDAGDGEPLRFTGNWFIDAGIIGFVNLMEEVYGWDLQELQRKLQKEKKLVYYWYFPIAFVYYNNKLRKENIREIYDEGLPSPPVEIPEEREIFEKAWEWICKKDNFIKGKRVDISFKSPFNYFTNFLFFQPSWPKNKQKKAFMEILQIKKIEEGVLKNIDKTINKFLFSLKEFNNIPYTKSPLTVNDLLNTNSYSLIYILCFPLAFQTKENIFFYSPSLKFTHKVNKKLLMYAKNTENTRQLIRATWEAVADALVEMKSIWVLESMYIISYKLGPRQNILKVKFISMPRLQAAFLLDDTIRNSINTKLEIDKKREVQKYLIEEFAKGQPLTPIVIKNIRLSLSEKERKIKIPIRTAITASALDLAYTSSKDLFSEDPLDRNFLSRNVEYVKRIISEAHSLRIAVSESTVQTNERLKEGLALRLLDLALKENKYEAINTALRVIIAHTKECDMAKLKHIINPLLKAINDNAPTWRVFIIAFSLGLLGGNQNV